MNCLFDETSINYTWEPAVEDMEEKQSDLYYWTPKKIFSRTAEETGIRLKTWRLYKNETPRFNSYLAQPTSFPSPMEDIK